MPLVPVSQRTGYTLEEVAEHKTAKSLWVIINRKVYDVTIFAKRHPGGEKVLLQMGGKDATAAAAAAHKNALPANLMWEFCIGSLVRFKVKPEETRTPVLAAAKVKAPATSTAKAAAPKPRGSLVMSNSSHALTPRVTPRSAGPPAATKEKRAAPGNPAPVDIWGRRDSGGIGSDAHGAEQGSGSQQSDPDPDGILAFGGEVGLSSVAATLADLIYLEPQLRRYADALGREELMEHLRIFLRGAFDGGMWPTVHVKRSLLELHFPDIAAALLDKLSEPLPLGEDLLSAAFTLLRQDREPRVARFYEALRDLIFFAPHRKMCAVQANPNVQLLEGKWACSDGRTAVVDGASCVLDGKDRQPLQLQQGSVVLDGWVASSTNGRSVQWVKAGQKMEWTRQEATTDLSRLPDGIWRNSSGLVCTVHEGVCTFVSKGPQPITVERGAAMLNGWRVVSITGASVTWERSGGRMEWQRLQTLVEVEPVVGVWKTGEGSFCTVAEGVCTFVTKGPVSLTLKDGLLNLSGWAATAIVEKTIRWRKGDKSMEWHRVESVQELKDLNGSWSISDGQRCTVLDGKVTFAAPASVVQLSMQGGLVDMKGFQAVAIRQQSVSWKKGAKTQEWTKRGETN